MVVVKWLYMDKIYRVYIILLNWNGWKDTVRCLESVFRSDYKDFRVIVCDNNSSDRSLEYIRQWAEGDLDPIQLNEDGNGPHQDLHQDLHGLFHPPVPKPVASGQLELIQTGSNRGFSAGNNVGIRIALRHNPDFIWLLNNDTLIQKDTLSTLVTFMEGHASVGLAGASIYWADAPSIVQTLGGGKLLPITGTDRFLLKPGPIQYVTGTSLFIRRKVLDDIGLLDEGFFFYWEDTDYSTRAGKAGWRMGTSDQSVVYHKHSATVGGQSLKSDLFKIASLGRYFKKHRPRTWWLPVGFNLLGMLVKRVLRGQFKRIPPILKEAFKRTDLIAKK